MKKLTIIISLISALCANAGDIFVSQEGSDTNYGTKDKPLKSIHAALQMAREWRRLNISDKTAGGITININNGTYYMDRSLFIRPEDSGTKDSPTIIIGNDGATISGGTMVEGWVKKGKLWVADAPTHTIRQLWVNGTWATKATQFGKDKMERMVDFDKEQKTITIPTPKNIKELKNSKNPEMMVHQRWATAILRVKDMKVSGSNTIVTFKEPESHIEFSHPWPQPVIGGEMGNSSYCLQNSLTLLDEPGEWYHDSDNGKIYYYPKENEKIGETTIYIPTKERLVTIEGAKHDKVRYIEFRNITFMYSSWNRPADQGHVTLQAGFPITDAYKLQIPGLPWAKNLENQAWVERPQAAVRATHADNITFNKCTFSNLACTALDYAEGVNTSKIENCTFNNIGGTAIMAGSFGEGAIEAHRPYVDKDDLLLMCHDITITGNKIKNATVEDWGAMAIGCGYVRDTRIENNHVDGCNWSGICIGWGWTPLDCGMRNNHIVGNTVINFAQQMHDSGAIYTMSAQPGSTIENNYIDKMGNAPYATNERAFYIYLDAETDGYTIRNNYCPEKKFGDNNPGPNIVWGENGKREASPKSSPKGRTLVR